MARAEDALLRTDVKDFMDATRISDGALVMLRKVNRSSQAREVKIAKFLAAEPRRIDSNNHCVPICAILEDPVEKDTAILVMPFLRKFDDPMFWTIGEVTECCRQLFLGVQFMHAHGIAHQDIRIENLMMDTSLYPKMFHPVHTHMNRDCTKEAKHSSRTERPVNYYIVDFSRARRYDVAKSQDSDAAVKLSDGAMSKVELFFARDVWVVSHLILNEFIREFDGFDFMRTLVDDMMIPNPAQRPTMDRVVARFAGIQKKLYWWRLRAPLLYVEGNAFANMFFRMPHAYLSTKWILRGYSALPVVRL